MASKKKVAKDASKKSRGRGVAKPSGSTSGKASTSRTAPASAPVKKSTARAPAPRSTTSSEKKKVPPPGRTAAAGIPGKQKPATPAAVKKSAATPAPVKKSAATPAAVKKSAATPAAVKKPTLSDLQKHEQQQKGPQEVKEATAQARSPSRSRAGSRPIPSGTLHPVLGDLSPVRSSKTSGPLLCVTSAPPSRPEGADAVLPTPTDGLVVPSQPLPGKPLLERRPLTAPPPEVHPDPSCLTLDENRGALSAHGYRLLLVHPESIIEIQNALEEKVGLEAGQIIFRGGYVIGLREARRQREAEVPEEEIVRSVANRCSAHGWGIFTIENLDLWRHELVFRVDHSPFAYAYGKASTGVDHMIRGVFSGVCEVIFDKKVVATEAMCRAMGDDHCQFMVG